MKSFRLAVREMKPAEMSRESYLEAARITYHAVATPPWNYHEWTIGEWSSKPGLSSAVGYLKLCDHFVLLLLEGDDGSSRIVGLSAGRILTKDLARTVDLRKGLDKEKSLMIFDGTRSDPGEGDFYQMIIAIDDAQCPDLLPIRGRSINNDCVSRLMLERLMDTAKRDGRIGFWAKTHPEVQKMGHLYESNGFEHVGSHISTYRGTRSPRLVYATNLAGHRTRFESSSIVGDWIQFSERG